MGTFFQIVNLFCSSQYSTSKHLHSLDLSRDRGSTYTSLDRPGLYTGYIIVLSLRSVSISSQLGSYPIVVFVVLFVVLRWLLGLSPQHLQQYHPLCIVFCARQWFHGASPYFVPFCQINSLDSCPYLYCWSSLCSD